MTVAQTDGVKDKPAAPAAQAIAPPVSKKAEAPAPIPEINDDDNALAEPVKVEKETPPLVEKSELASLIDEWDE